MDFSNISLFSLLKQKMNYLSKRQSVLAQNVANANTPGYAAKDLQTFTVDKGSAGGIQPASTHPMHLSGGGSHGGAYNASTRDKPFEITISGNSVSLEEEMMKMADTATDYQTATSVYRKMMEMFRTAVGGNR